jgi:hypothetical protein
MIQALNTALAGYSARSEDILRMAERIRGRPLGENVAQDLVGLMVGQRAAEANLAVAHVAYETSGSLLHVIA